MQRIARLLSPHQGWPYRSRLPRRPVPCTCECVRHGLRPSRHRTASRLCRGDKAPRHCRRSCCCPAEAGGNCRFHEWGRSRDRKGCDRCPSGSGALRGCQGPVCFAAVMPLRVRVDECCDRPSCDRSCQAKQGPRSARLKDTPRLDIDLTPLIRSPSQDTSSAGAARALESKEARCRVPSNPDAAVGAPRRERASPSR
jgi:hypothetical protein